MSQRSRGQGSRPGGERRGGRNRGHSTPQGGGRGHNRGSAQLGAPRAPEPPIYNPSLSTTLEPRLSDDTQAQLIASFNQLRVRERLGPGRPLRPGYGTRGEPITLRANFFAVKLPGRQIYAYSVEIEPEVRDKERRALLFQLLEQTRECAQYLPYIAHDRGTRLISAKKLPTPLVFTVVAHGDNKPLSYTFKIQPRTPEELSPADLTKYLAGDYNLRSDEVQGGCITPLISALNIVLQSHASITGIRVGRQGNSDETRETGEVRNRYFFPDLKSESFKLNLDVTAVMVYFASVRPSLKQLMVNVNACMTPFFEPGNLGIILLRFRDTSYGALPSLPEHFLKAQVTTTYRGYKKRYRINWVENKSARKATFKHQNKDTTVENYFKTTYNIDLKYPDELPVINVANNILIPAELCEIEAQPYRGKLTKEEGRKMQIASTKKPHNTAELIVDQGLPALNLTSKSEFGIQIDKKMTNVPARILPPPRVAYGTRHANVEAQSASWKIANSRFQKAAIIQSWWVMVVNDGRPVFTGEDDKRLKDLVDGFQKKLSSVGLSVPQDQPMHLFVNLPRPHVKDPPRERALDVIRTKLKENIRNKPKPSFMLVLLSRVDPCIYPGIKRISDVELGMHTVHMLLAGSRDKPPAPLDPVRRDQCFSNIALKINTKLGGVNHSLDENSMRWLNKKKTMIVGIDVTHPSADSKYAAPSIAAVVASTDSTFAQYPASLRLQESRKEIVMNLGDMMKERLELYKKHNDTFPELIIVFRDGVSEGQFKLLIETEIPQIIESFKRLESRVQGRAYRPALSYIVCGKRHHVRFFATNPIHADRGGNNLPGTVVDRGVTAVFDFDFYLQAHAALQGTARSTHYTVVYDEMKFSADELQQGINNSCYIYGRANKAVSLIPAAYYADLACDRARFYLNELLNLSGKRGIAKPKTEAQKEAEKKRVFEEAVKKWGDGVHADIRESMFYL